MGGERWLVEIPTFLYHYLKMLCCGNTVRTVQKHVRTSKRLRLQDVAPSCFSSLNLGHGAPVTQKCLSCAFLPLYFFSYFFFILEDSFSTFQNPSYTKNPDQSLILLYKGFFWTCSILFPDPDACISHV